MFYKFSHSMVLIKVSHSLSAIILINQKHLNNLGRVSCQDNLSKILFKSSKQLLRQRCFKVSPAEMAFYGTIFAEQRITQEPFLRYIFKFDQLFFDKIFLRSPFTCIRKTNSIPLQLCFKRIEVILTTVLKTKSNFTLLIYIPFLGIGEWYFKCV